MCGNGSWHIYGMRSVLPLEPGVTLDRTTILFSDSAVEEIVSAFIVENHYPRNYRIELLFCVEWTLADQVIRSIHLPLLHRLLKLITFYFDDSSLVRHIPFFFAVGSLQRCSRICSWRITTNMVARCLSPLCVAVWLIQKI
jgi:hypothetical protein